MTASMIRKITYLLLVVFAGMTLCSAVNPAWGFFGHRKINRMAIYTLPSEMIKFFKDNIEYITAHAVDPDKRRYATKHEAVRHYIDIDHWGNTPFDDVPRELEAAVIKYGKLYMVNGQDTTLFTIKDDEEQLYFESDKNNIIVENIDRDSLSRTMRSYIRDQYFDGEIVIPVSAIASFSELRLVDSDSEIHIEDQFSAYGILPYHLEQYYRYLVKAFNSQNENSILRLSAEMGHYIGDAHVPLHTTENYNGQLTDQVGIHGFWESRLPELFADEQYDFFVGKADYIEDKKAYFWDIIYDSHTLLDSVLSIEKRLSQSFPRDQQYCYDQRLDITIRTQCPEYAAAFHNEMEGMVEDRMQDAILSLGSVWYSAWIDAGQPDLSRIGEVELAESEQNEIEELNKAYQGGDIKGRAHDQ